MADSLTVEKQTTLDLLDIKTPALSSTSDMPVIETKPDSLNEGKPPAPAPEENAEVAAEEKAETPAPSEETGTPPASDEPKKAKGVQKRIDELTRQREDERRRAEAAEARLDRALSALEKGTSKETKTDDQEPQKPVRDPLNPEGYDAALEAYVTARSSWIARKEVQSTLAEAEKKRQDDETQKQVRATQDSYRARVEKVKEKYADYSEVAESPDIQVSIAMASAIAHAEDGPEIAYFLGKNAQEAERISKLRPELQLVELGKISMKLSTPAAKPISQAPSPGKPIKASSETVKADEELSMEEYAAKRKKEWAERGRPGVRH